MIIFHYTKYLVIMSWAETYKCFKIPAYCWSSVWKSLSSFVSFLLEVITILIIYYYTTKLFKGNALEIFFPAVQNIQSLNIVWKFSRELRKNKLKSMFYSFSWVDHTERIDWRTNWRFFWYLFFFHVQFNNWSIFLWGQDLQHNFRSRSI